MWGRIFKFLYLQFSFSYQPLECKLIERQKCCTAACWAKKLELVHHLSLSLAFFLAVNFIHALTPS